MPIKASELDLTLLRRSTRAAVTVALAAAAAVMATLITAATPLLAHNVFLLPLFAVLVSALFGGTAAGLTASIMSTAGTAYAIMPPLGSLAIGDRGDQTRVAFLLGLGLLITALSRALRTARSRVAERERALRESEASYRDLFDNNADPLWIVDEEGRIVEANRAAELLYGFEPGTMVGLSPADLTDLSRIDFDAERHRLERALRGEPQRFEWWGLTRTGRTIPLDMTLSRTLYFGRAAVLVLARDTTERRALEGQLRQAQKMEAMGQLAGGVSHDFNNLLTTIRGHAELLGRALPGEDPRREHLIEIDRAADIATHVTRQLLSFSRRSEDGQQELIPLNPVIERLEQMLRRVIGADIEIELDLEPNVGAVLMDPGQLEQVVLNLVVNARDAMPEGGTITLTTSSSMAGSDAERRACLAVTDTGVGMDQETVSRAFEPFFTTKTKGEGTGLGLSTVYGIVERHGGRIRIQSEPGHGTTVAVDFRCQPVSTPTASAGAGTTGETATAGDTAAIGRGGSPPAPAGERSERILLVEDEDPVRSLMARVLTTAGHDVEGVESAERAQTRFDAEDTAFTVLVTDMSLPGDSGAALARWVRTRDPGIPVLLASGSDRAELNISTEPGMAFLPKPFSPGELVEAVERLRSDADDGHRVV